MEHVMLFLPEVQAVPAGHLPVLLEKCFDSCQCHPQTQADLVAIGFLFALLLCLLRLPSLEETNPWEVDALVARTLPSSGVWLKTPKRLKLAETYPAEAMKKRLRQFLSAKGLL